MTKRVPRRRDPVSGSGVDVMVSLVGDAVSTPADSICCFECVDIEMYEFSGGQNVFSVQTYAFGESFDLKCFGCADE